MDIMGIMRWQCLDQESLLVSIMCTTRLASRTTILLGRHLGCRSGELLRTHRTVAAGGS